MKRCQGPCGLDKPDEAFDPKRAWCKACMNLKRREYYRSGPGKEARQRYRRKMAAADRAADRVYGKTLRKRDSKIPSDHMDVEHVRRWLDRIELTLPDDAAVEPILEGMCRLSSRRLYDIRHKNQSIVTLDVAERIAQAADAMDEFESILGDVGKENWSPHGDRFCRRCGTWWRKHWAKGLCKRCYGAIWLANKQRKEIGEPDLWARYSHHTVCIICERSTHKHQCHGVCRSCYKAVRDLAQAAGMSMGELIESGGYTAYKERKLLWLSLNPKGKRRKKKHVQGRKWHRMDEDLRRLLTPALRVELKLTRSEVMDLSAMPYDEAVKILETLLTRTRRRKTRLERRKRKEVNANVGDND